MRSIETDVVHRASAPYLRYCNGIWIAQHPEQSFELAGEQDLETDGGREGVVDCLEKQLLDGARGFLKACFPDGVTQFQQARNMYDSIEPRARIVLEQVVERERERLEQMNPAFWRLRPASFIEVPLYTYLTHCDYARVKTRALLGVFAPHAMLREIINEERTLRSTQTHTKDTHRAS